MLPTVLMFIIIISIGIIVVIYKYVHKYNKCTTTDQVHPL